MKISTKIRYGTRAMLELASHFGEGAIELKEIAQKESIPPKYLEQVIIPLRTAGLVKSARGSRGGYSLAKPPSEIRLKDVYEVLEGPVHLVDCLRDPKVCQKVSSCVTREIWQEVSEAISKVFNSVTLEDMLERKKKKEEMVPSMYQI
jgi:Rrf2 family transcriptional regulator, cysteine metabolism repressor